MTFPVVAPGGTGTVIDVALQGAGVAGIPLNCTVLLPWVPPKLLPETVTEVPTGPTDGVTLLMIGAGTTVNVTPLLDLPLTVTITLPVVAPVGTDTTIEVTVHVVAVAAVVPLNFTVLVPCGDPKPLPVIVTDAPTAPDVGDRLVMLGPTAIAALLKKINMIEATTSRARI
jgi:hypothetical protein